MVVLSGPLFSLNLVLKPRILSVRTVYVLSPLHVALNSKSGDSHLEDLDGALRLFKRLAELDFV
jgi:hypothetical protein